MTKTGLITGTSSGIGFAAAHHFAEQGWNVVATMRKPSCDAGNALSQLKNLLVLPLDVTDRDAIHKIVRDTIAHFGDLHVLINNAGYGLAGPMEFATPEQIDRQYKTNLYGPIFLMQAVLPHMRSKASGVIVNVTSVGGRLVLPFNSLYHGTKYALEGISESANLELAPLGIRIKLVEPGGVKTDFAGRSLVMTASETVTAYNDMLSHAIESFGKILANSPPDLIARVLYEAATDETEKMRFPAGEDAKVMLKTRASASDEDHQKAMTQQFNLLCDKNQ